MTGTLTSSTQASLPLPKHALTLRYFRLRAIAVLVQIPLTILLSLSYYLRDKSVLRKYGVSRTHITVPSRQKGRSIKVDIYTPTLGVKKPFPVHINWHGSGFVLPCFGADTEICAYLANKAGCIVLDADYRKAPQNPFPACIQDGEDVCNFVLAQSQVYDAKKISIGGSSAGACIALAVGAQLGPEKIQAVCSIAPPTDFRVSSRPKIAKDPGHRFALPSWATLFFDSCYLVINSDRSDPLLSPICAPSSSFPESVYIATGTGDTLYSDGLNLIEKLKKDNHPNAIFRSVQGAGHGFEKFRLEDPHNFAGMIMQDIVSVIEGSWTQAQPSKASRM
ncbi:hypothetical protein CBS101457_005462 [Exobasidium rhododendri]|nr:hypothetical protein CBS101457_005462 [Exobasidium rhododendri]